MSKKINPKGKDKRIDHTSARLAGGFGARPAKQDAESLLRRSVMACLLWEDLAYESGQSVTDNIEKLIPLVDPKTVADIAIESREKQKLRQVPLFLVVQMAKYPETRKLIREVIRRVVTRADQMSDLLALYWKDGRKPVPNQMKLGLADAFQKFNEYQFAKYDRDGAVKLRDVLRICHAKPTQGKEELFKKVNERTLETPNTWEVALSAGKDKKETWTRLIENQELPDLAYLRNLRGMIEAKVSDSTIRSGLKNIKSGFLLPLNFFAAVKYANRFEAEIEEAMLKVYSVLPKLPGHTVFVMDVSGSMRCKVSDKSQFTRIEAGSAMAVLAREQCESVSVYATAGSDGNRIHKTARLSNTRGFSLCKAIGHATENLGGGGIFTRQCLDYIKDDLGTDVPDRIIIFSDSQDCDYSHQLPKPFGKYNYIVDVSAHKNGINYEGIWTAEISGWSEHFITFIAALEGLTVPEEENEQHDTNQCLTSL